MQASGVQPSLAASPGAVQVQTAQSDEREFSDSCCHALILHTAVLHNSFRDKSVRVSGGFLLASEVISDRVKHTWHGVAAGPA